MARFARSRAVQERGKSIRSVCCNILQAERDSVDCDRKYSGGLGRGAWGPPQNTESGGLGQLQHTRRFRTTPVETSNPTPCAPHHAQPECVAGAGLRAPLRIPTLTGGACKHVHATQHLSYKRPAMPPTRPLISQAGKDSAPCSLVPPHLNRQALGTPPLTASPVRRLVARPAPGPPRRQRPAAAPHGQTGTPSASGRTLGARSPKIPGGRLPPPRSV